MTNTLRTLCLFTLLLASGAASAQSSTPDSLVRKLFASLQAKDEKAYVALYPNATQMGSLVRSMMEGMFKSEQMRTMMAADENAKNMNIDSLIDASVAEMTKPGAEAEMQKEFGKTFRETLQRGERKGVDWRQAELQSITLDSSTKANDADAQMFATAGVKTVRGVVDFTSGGTAYQANFEKIIYVPSEQGWFGGEFKQVIRKGESFATDEGSKLMDTDNGYQMDAKATQNLKRQAAGSTAKPAGTKTKTKAKTTTGKTKAKTKS